MSAATRKLRHRLLRLWSTTNFSSRELSAYAERLMVGETRKGVMVMSLVLTGLLLAAMPLYGKLGFADTYLYTSGVLAVLAFHIFLSARGVSELKVLHLLGITLLTVSATALVSIAHQTGSFTAALFASTVLLFMVVPMVPWGIREAVLVTLTIYGLFTSSTLSVPSRFDSETLWTLQFFMLSAGATSLALVALNVSVRKHDVEARFGLEEAHRRLVHLSNVDPLTGAWNRRFLKHEFARLVRGWREGGKMFHFAFVDLDDFKPLNDSFGHEFGDKVLHWLSAAFMDALGTDGHLVRLGGDEFALVFADVEPLLVLESGCDGLAERVREHATGKPPEVRLSIGLASVSPSAQIALEEIYRVADAALYEAKARKAHGLAHPNVVRHTVASPSDEETGKVAEIPPRKGAA